MVPAPITTARWTLYFILPPSKILDKLPTCPVSEHGAGSVLEPAVVEFNCALDEKLVALTLKGMRLPGVGEALQGYFQDLQAGAHFQRPGQGHIDVLFTMVHAYSSLNAVEK